MRQVFLTAVLAALGTLVLARPGLAQPPEATFDVRAVAPRPAPELRLERTQPLEQTRLPEQDFYPGPVQSGHEPAFVQPVVATVPVSRKAGIRVGLSGWAAPPVPFDMPEATGGIAFGLTILWEVPVAPAPETPAPDAR